MDAATAAVGLAQVDEAEVLTLLGDLAAAQGQRQAAIDRWLRAIVLAPAQAPAHLRLAEILAAVAPAEASRHAARAASLQPRQAAPWLLVATLAAAQGARLDAIVALERLLACPRTPQEALRAAVLAGDLGQQRASARLAEEAVQGGLQAAHAVLVEAQANLAEWDALAASVPRLLAGVPDPSGLTGPMAIAWSADDPTLVRRTAEAQASSLGRMPPATRPERPAGRLPTIAYCTPDLCEHPVAHMLLPVLRAHDRRRVRVLTIGLRPAAPGTGNAVVAAGDGHIDVAQLDDGRAAELIATAGIDVLIDCAGATPGARYGLLARRPPPRQVLWLGCPTGVGGGWHDAILLDGMTCPPGGEAAFRETVVRLPVCYHPITAAGAPAPATRREQGLPEEAVVVACPHALRKIRPATVDRWLRIAATCPGAVLWFDICTAEAQQRVRAYAAARGVPAQRICFRRFAPDRSAYLGQLRLADLLLDNHPYGAHSTAGEALAVGVPVLTPGGAGVAARVASAMLHELGLPQLARDGLDDWEREAVRLIADPGELRAARTAVATAAPRLAASVPRLASAIEDACLRLAGISPAAAPAVP